MHAGINPTTPDVAAFLGQPCTHPRSQMAAAHNWAWVREPFLLHRLGFTGPDGRPAVVVHGHTRLNGITGEGILSESLSTLEQGRICLDCSGTDMALVLEAEGPEFTLRIAHPEPEPDMEP